MRDLDELNINEGGRPVTRQPPTTEQIAKFQHNFGVELPDDYIAFLRYSNGGHPKLDSYIPRRAPEDQLWSVNHFYFLNDDQNHIEGLWAATRAWQAVLKTKIVAIGNDGGGNQLVLSFDHNPPSVEICIHDEEMRMIPVAESFGEFVDMLTEDPDMI